MKTMRNILLLLTITLTVTTISYGGSNTPIADEEQPLFRSDIAPKFKGKEGREGIIELRKWVESKIKYPKEAKDKNISGAVALRFVIDKNGELKDFVVLDSPSKILTDEVIRAMKKAPKWTPAEDRGKKVSVYATIRIVFSSDDNKEEAKQVISRPAAPTSPLLIDGEAPIFKPEIAPAFQGLKAGYESAVAFRKWVQERVKYPKELVKKKVTGSVNIRFVIDKNGEIVDINVLSSPSPIMTKEVTRVIESAPAWKPGQEKGKPVPVYATIRIVFAI